MPLCPPAGEDALRRLRTAKAAQGWAVGPAALPYAGGFPPQRPPPIPRPATAAPASRSYPLATNPNPQQFPLPLMPFVDHKKVLRCSPRPSVTSADKKVLRCSPRPSVTSADKKGVKVFSASPPRLPASSVDQKVLKCSPCPFVLFVVKRFPSQPYVDPPIPSQPVASHPENPLESCKSRFRQRNPSPHRRTSPYPLSPIP